MGKDNGGVRVWRRVCPLCDRVYRACNLGRRPTVGWAVAGLTRDGLLAYEPLDDVHRVACARRRSDQVISLDEHDRLVTS